MKGGVITAVIKSSEMLANSRKTTDFSVEEAEKISLEKKPVWD